MNSSPSILKMRYNESLFYWFIQRLETEGVAVNTTLAISLQQLFDHYGIVSADNLSAASNAFVAVLAKSSSDQQQLRETIAAILNGIPPENSSTHKKYLFYNLRFAEQQSSRQFYATAAGLSLAVSIILLAFFVSRHRTAPPPKLKIEIYGQTIVGKTIRFVGVLRPVIQTSFRWKFDDDSRELVTKTGTTSHIYKKEGDHVVTLTVLTDDKAIITKQLIHVFPLASGPVKRANTKDVPPLVLQDKGSIIIKNPYLYKRNYAKKKLKHFSSLQQVTLLMPLENDLLLIRMLLLLIVAAVLAWIIFGRQTSSLTLDRFFDPGDKIVPPFQLSIKSEPVVYQRRQLAELAAWLTSAEEAEREVFDASRSLYETAANFGFPNLRFKKKKEITNYLVIIDKQSLGAHFSELISGLLGQLRQAGLQIEEFYCRPDMDNFKSSGLKFGLKRAQLQQRFSRSRLIIYSDGNQFLNDYEEEGFNTALISFIALWEERALVTSKPRVSWSFPEKKLKQIMQVYPADMGGHSAMAQSFYSGKISVTSVNTGFLPYPLSSTIPNYRAYFLALDPAGWLYRWVLCLSLPDELNWSLVLLIGRNVESFASLPDGALVCHDSLLSINHLAWVSRKNLSFVHRQELNTELEAIDSGVLTVRVKEMLLNVYEANNAPEGSTAAVVRNLKIVSLKYQLLGNSGQADGSLMRELFKKGLLDAQTAALVAKHRPWHLSHRQYLLLFLLSIFTFFCFAFVNITESYLPQFRLFDSLHLWTDSSVYYNNKAVRLLNKPANEETLKEAKGYLNRALYYNFRNDTALYNYHVANYQAGVFYYDHNFLPDAARTFDHFNQDGYFYKILQLRDYYHCPAMNPSVQIFVNEITAEAKLNAARSRYYIYKDATTGIYYPETEGLNLSPKDIQTHLDTSGLRL